MKEAISLQQEEMASQLAHISALREKVEISLSNELQQDLLRLRDEAFQARRGEVLKERQVKELVCVFVFAHGQMSMRCRSLTYRCS